MSTVSCVLTLKTVSLPLTPPANTSITSHPAKFLLRRLRLRMASVVAACILFTSSMRPSRDIWMQTRTILFNAGYWYHELAFEGRA